MIELDFDTDEILIFDDVLTDEQSDIIYKNFLTLGQAWQFLPRSVDPRIEKQYSDENTFESHLFSMSFYGNDKLVSEYWEKCGINFISHKISEKLGHKLFYNRVKANLQIDQNTDKKYNTPHRDLYSEKHLIVIYYVNTSDSPTTVFKNNSAPWEVEKVVESKKGRFLVFSGKKFHAGMHPKKDPHRIMINFVVTQMEKIEG